MKVVLALEVVELAVPGGDHVFVYKNSTNFSAAHPEKGSGVFFD